MASLHTSSPAFHRALFLNASPPPSLLQGSAFSPGQCSRRGASLQARAEASASHPQDCFAERSGRRQAIILGAVATSLSLCHAETLSFAAEVKKGFQNVLDKKDGYSLLYPFGWQEVVIQGQDKVFKDVIEPLESVSVDIVETSKQDIRDLGSPQEVAEALIKKVLAPPSQKTKLVEAAEHDVDGTAYYTFEFVAQAPNFSRHALGAVCIGNGKFYTLTTGANERRWEKMKDRLHTVIDSFRIFTPTIL